MLLFGRILLILQDEIQSMIREQIQEKMNVRGVNQSMLCKDLGLTISNFNAFLHGKRTMPYKMFIDVLQYLRLSVAPEGMTLTEVSADQLPDILRFRVKQLHYRIADVEKMSGINKCSVASIITGKRMPSTRNLDRIMQALSLEIVNYRKPKDETEAENQCAG